ncbi:unnamed protein product [Mesocestoides corti]|uniref:Integron gene cassette protein n=1 Tax=Mesocestoides corti TaxID=53468 RepID=A0A0R3UGC2_MESCO|nr:unnamed protein product [Mesocestoides corti]
MSRTVLSPDSLENFCGLQGGSGSKLQGVTRFAGTRANQRSAPWPRALVSANENTATNSCALRSPRHAGSLETINKLDVRLLTRQKSLASPGLALFTLTHETPRATLCKFEIWQGASAPSLPSVNTPCELWGSFAKG